MAKYIFIGTFIAAFIIQGVQWKEFGITDDSMWAHQAEYVQTGDPREFNPLWAYGHPGGPIIDGTIAIHSTFHISYDNAILIFLTFFNSLAIGLVCLLCYLLRKDTLWWLVSLGTLSLDRLYEYATPPSAIASVFVVLLCVFTLYLYENKNKLREPNFLALWSLIAGLTVATRADIGSIVTATCAIILIGSLYWKTVIKMLLGAFVVFAVFDPFMWFMPIQHMADLISKAIFHYAEFTTYRLQFWSVVSISSLAFVGIFLAISFICMRKNMPESIPSRFSTILIGMTVLIYIVFLTSRFQAIRYFMPVIFIWEIFLPLFLFSLVSQIKINFISTEKNQKRLQLLFQICIVVLLIGYPTLFLGNAFYLNAQFHLLP